MSARVTVYSAQARREAVEISTEDRIEVAHLAANDAIAAAPVLSGRFRNGIRVEVEGDRVSLIDDDPDGGWKEYGTEDTPAHATLTDAARRYGKYSGIQPGR